MKKTIFLLSFLLITISYSAYSQMAVGYSFDGNTLAISTDPSNKKWGEFRVNTKDYNQASWSYSDRGITQAYFMISFYTSGVVSLYAGAGVGMNLLSNEDDKWFSLNIPVGLKMNPIKALPNMILFGEYDPMIIIEENIPTIQSFTIGFRFRLGKEE